jgi:hypothetical protein
MLGQWLFFSAKLADHPGPHQGRCIAHMYALHVQEVLDTWPEGHERTRVWVSSRRMGGAVTQAGEFNPFLTLF